MKEHVSQLRAAMEIVRKRRLPALLGISTATIDRIRKDPSYGFPAPVRLGEQAIGWLRADIEAWLAARPRVAQ